MRLPVVLSTVFAFALSSNAAFAERDFSSAGIDVTPRAIYVEIDESLADVWYPDLVEPNSHSGSHTLYINPCWGGETFSPGFNDSRTNRSSIISSTRNLPQYAYGMSSFNAVVSCVRDLMGPFNIQVVTDDPGSTPHHEAVVCGHANDLGFSSGVGGVAPFTCGVIENSITYTFPEVWGNDPRTHCETIAQEAAHAWGLDHEVMCEDPMTYLTGCGNKSYQNEYAQCGEYEPRACNCGGTQQNSVARIKAVFGGSTPTPPIVTITEPLNNAAVSPGFVVRVDLQDNDGIKDVTLYVDDQQILTLDTPPYVFNGPDSLADGSHEVTIIAHDSFDATGSDTIFVIVGEPCSPGDCTGGEVCVDGRCVPGPDADGGLGDTCENGDDCLNGMCGQDGDGTKLCTEPCDPEADGCPSGFECKTAGSGGVCWPGGGGGTSGGCGVALGERRAPWAALVLIGLVAGALVRRRRR